jgi:hypothetical protein
MVFYCDVFGGAVIAFLGDWICCWLAKDEVSMKGAAEGLASKEWAATMLGLKGYLAWSTGDFKLKPVIEG